MHGSIGRVLKLLWNDGVVGAGQYLLGLGYRALHALGARGEHQRGAIGLDELAALLAHGVGHDDDGLVALGSGHHGQTHTRVAAGGLDDGAARLERATALGVLDHGQGNAVFHAAAGVEVLKFHENACFQVLFTFDCRQFKQWSVADEAGDVLINFTHNDVFFKRILCIDCD